MEINTHSTRGKVVGKKFRQDRSVPGQRCVTYHDYDVSEIKTQAKKEKIEKHNSIRTQ